MILKPTINPFSRYADKQERKVDRFLRRITFKNKFEIERELSDLMQNNLIILNLWLEAKFKGYKYLKKRKRKRMYANAKKIADTFLAFAAKRQSQQDRIIAKIERHGVKVEQADVEKLIYLDSIMTFLKPGHHYEYLEGASFGKLLTDIENTKMIGDCNQITTFYVFLYSLKFPVKDLQIKLPKDHVCLHFKGIDIEATNGTFQKYKVYEYVLPITELISTNLLDVSDIRDKTVEIEPMEFLKGAKLAFNISSHREIVQRNLKVAYNNVAVDALNSNKFKTAEYFFGQTGNRKALKSVYHNAVIYHVKHNNFKKARYFVGKSGDSEMRKYVDEKEAFYYFDKNKTDRARRLFQQAGNDKMVKACYGKDFNALQRKVRNMKTLKQMKSHRYTYRKMLDLANKMGDRKLAGQVRNILKQI